jgi:hypothetical protein
LLRQGGLAPIDALGKSAKQVLYVVTYLVCDYVSLREFARGVEATSQFIEEAKIEIDLFVFRTVEGADSFLRRAATRVRGVPEQYKPRV